MSDPYSAIFGREPRAELAKCRDLVGQCGALAQRLRAQVGELQREVAALRADRDRLNALDLLTHGYGRGWVLRESTSNRGMRLQETSREDASPTVREAIDKYLTGGQSNG